MGRSKYTMGQLVDGAWYCECSVRAQWKTAGVGTPNAKRKFQRCANSRDPKLDCRFFLWEDDRLEAEAAMRGDNNSRKNLPPGGGIGEQQQTPSRKRTAQVAELDGGGSPTPITGNMHRSRRQPPAGHGRSGTTPTTPGPPRVSVAVPVPVLAVQHQQRDEAHVGEDDTGGPSGGRASAAAAGSGRTAFDAIMSSRGRPATSRSAYRVQPQRVAGGESGTSTSTTTTPTKTGLSARSLPGPVLRPDEEASGVVGGDMGGGAADDGSTFDAIMGILADCGVEVPREARLRIQAEVLDQMHALEEGRQRIRHLEEKVGCLVELVKGKRKGKEKEKAPS